ncbi:N-acetylmuramoyl-L-alanine amidase [Limosilactobacillus caecicola]|uniref:N-acetylmuramoyl-L-alanine amidase n=1 Tax=Limosilactobacillus caecicola TaxID=2941332 RepID=UPI00203E4B92|nr:N-acetylmuramoyl-L-alanine amidase [Limosilactobacillus caecicola]
MEIKKRFKLYKSGKLWCCAALVAAGLAFGSQSVAHADTDTTNANDTTQVAEANTATVRVASLATNTNVDGVANSKVQSTNFSSTTTVDNKMPTDTTTTNNQTTANQGHLDGTTLSSDPTTGQGQLTVTGWHATGQSKNEQYRYMILYDNTTGREIERQAIAPQQRNDVQAAYPHIAGSDYAGFDVTFTLPAGLSGHSLSVIDRYSNDPLHGEGSRTDYWFGPIYIEQDNRANLDNISSADGKVTVSGWHASNQAMGKKYHYIIAYDSTTGREIARQLVTNGVSRKDVAAVYPNTFNAANSGFNVTFTLTSQYARDDIQFVSRWTNDPAGNGANTVDYWFNPVTKNNRGSLDSWSISNGNLQVSGWHADDVSVYEPYHYLIVKDQTTGQVVAAHQVALQSSADVKKVYPDTTTAGQARFNYSFSGLNLTPGHTYVLISRYSQSATGDGSNGVYTDYTYPTIQADSSAYNIDSLTRNGNTLQVSGWFANSASASQNHPYVILILNGKEVGRQAVTLTQRTDVANAYPHLYGSLYSGFNTSFNIPTGSTGDFQLVLRFSNNGTNGEGSHTDIWSSTYATNAGNFDSIKVSTNSATISGWHAAWNTSDKPYQYIIAMDASTNTELQRWNIAGTSGQTRNDVAKAYPYIPGSDKSGFTLTISNIDNLKGHTVKFIHRYTDDAAGNGNYVDYYSSPVNMTVYNANMYANSINAYIANNHIGHASIQTDYVIPAVTGAYSATGNGKPNMIVVHETANPNDSIWGEINYEKSTYNNAFVHAFVDGNNIIEISSTDRECWGAGPQANHRAVQFEQVEVHTASEFVRELVNAAYYTAYNLKKYGLEPTLGPSGSVWSHHMVSQNLGGTNHTDPDGYWSTNASIFFGTHYTMSDFIELVKYEYNQL